MTMDFKVQLAKDVGKDVVDIASKCGMPIMEPKYDGWRCIVIHRGTHVDIYNRSQKCYTGQLPELEAELMKLPEGTILDGELVDLTCEEGVWTNDFYNIHSCMRSKDVAKLASKRRTIKLIAFDILSDGHTQEPLAHRRQMIQQLLDEFAPQGLELTIQMHATQENHDYFVGLGFEGTVIKDQLAVYGFGKRGHGWYKVKATTTIDCFVTEILMDGKGQYEGQAGRMAVGQWDDRGNIVERAKVNCPDQKTRLAMTADPDFFIGQVVEVKVYGYSEDGNPRHPTFVRWRDDKRADDCSLSNV